MAQQRPDDKVPENQKQVHEMVERLNSILGDSLAKAGVQAEAVLRQVFEADTEETLSDDYVRRTLKSCVSMAAQVVGMTSAVLGTVEISTLRRILAGDFKLPDMMRQSLKAVGVDPAEFEGVEPDFQPSADSTSKAADPRKRPRGSKHPLVVMVEQGMRASQLVERITRATNPAVYNLRVDAT